MKKKLLIIEDEPALVKGLEMALGEEHEVLIASTAAEGLKQAKKELPDLILLDILLPDKNGLDVLQDLKANEKTDDIPILVLTNLGDSETVSKIIAAGGREYLVKSDWKIDDVVKKVESFFD